MHLLSRLFWFSLALVATVLVTGESFAAHSFCVTGTPMVQGAGNATTNAVVANVCGTTPRCCSSRWDLSCVQIGARYARDSLSAGDVCGRYAWTQGPIPGTGQFYPRDFNLFATNGAVTNIRDTDGPIAGSSTVSLNSFNLNIKQREPVALLAGSSPFLTSGTVAGTIVYKGTLNDVQVTYVGNPRPASATNPFPVDFAAAQTKLIAMAQALKAYDAVAATKQYSTVTFTGTDPELNVFSVPLSMLSGTYSYAINVPQASNVIINVLGTNPAIKYAGFSGSGFPLSSLLWNFPDATSLVLDSVGFPGSILAPRAVADLRNGSVSGTVVVAAGTPANVELYSSPYRVPSTVGAPAVDVDTSWSFTGNVSDDRTATELKYEAGFLAIDGSGYTSEAHGRVAPNHRVWYSFQPAAIQPKKKPLAVFFQGGPGHATSSILFAFNTGLYTLDPSVVGANKIAFNPSTWTQFANVLYIDTPGAGFSYCLPISGMKPSVGIDPPHDAGIFNRVILRFLKRHPELLSNRVLIVGESYSGVRSTLMLQHMFNVSSLLTSGSPYIDLPLWAEETDYFTRVFGTGTPSAAQIATKWGHQVLIDAVLAGRAEADNRTVGTPYQFPASSCLSPTCSDLIPGVPIQPDACDPYNCDKPVLWSDQQEHMASANLVLVNTLSQALGVGGNIKNIEWMKASARTTAYGRNDGTIVAAPELDSLFGTIPPGSEDNYFLEDNQAVLDGYPGTAAWDDAAQSQADAIAFSNHLHNGVSTFMTAARFDLVVWAPEIPYSVATFAASVLPGGVVYNQTWNTGLPRPGAFWLRYTADGVDQRMITMPHFYESGHSVSMRAPAALLADVTQWYNSSPH